MATNLFVRFKKLVQPKPQRIGTVLSVVGTSVVIEESGGGTARLIGEATVGQKVYFRDDLIVGIAPNLTIVTVEE